MNALKRSLLTLAALAACSTSALFAQPPAGERPPGSPAGENGRGRGGPGMGMSAEERLQWLGEQLGLTDEQKTQIKPIVLEEVAAAKAVFDDKSLTGEARREKMRTIRESFGSKIEAVLTPEQKTKYEKIKAMRGPGGPRREREDKK